MNKLRRACRSDRAPARRERTVTAAVNEEDLAITLGVEEEFFLVDPGSRDLLADPDPAIFETCEKTRGPHKVVREFLHSQIETNTRVC